MPKQDRSMQPRYVAMREERQKRILTKASTPEGWGLKDFTGSHSDTLGNDAKRLVAEGKLFAASISCGHRYFATVELRKAFLAKKQNAPRGRPAGAGTKTAATFKPNAEVVTPAHVQIQYAPKPRGRYEVVGPIVGGFMDDWRTKRGERAAA